MFIDILLPILLIDVPKIKIKVLTDKYIKTDAFTYMYLPGLPKALNKWISEYITKGNEVNNISSKLNL
ncbi:hypothetical protein [Algibacter sp. Ld11]|uniref:hypothetical protein n=1 Tax=Algibacter sp. Ld11 TaxID=649150 RepID=UPI00386CB1D6